MAYAKNNYDEKTMARAKAVDVGVSTKTSIEVCNFIRNRSTKKAKSLLEQVLKKELAVPFKRFNWNVGHRPGDMGPGRYPQKVTEEILKLINQVESNAASKGLSTDDLIITHLVVNKAAGQWRMGRQGRRKAKRSHIEIMVTGSETKKSKSTAKPAKEEAVEAKPVKEAAPEKVAETKEPAEKKAHEDKKVPSAQKPKASSTSEKKTHEAKEKVQK